MSAASAVLAFYERTAQQYAECTRGLDMSSMRAEFLAEMAPRGHIADAGCGSGRDALAFRALGYAVTAFDGSARLAALASSFTGQPVQTMRFDELKQEGVYDGVWACASLVHLEDEPLVDALSRLLRSLKPAGTFFTCFKLGDGLRMDERGRPFNDFSVDRVRLLIRSCGGEMVRTWLSDDRAGSSSSWVNVLARSAASAAA